MEKKSQEIRYPELDDDCIHQQIRECENKYGKTDQGFYSSLGDTSMVALQNLVCLIL